MHKGGIRPPPFSTAPPMMPPGMANYIPPKGTGNKPPQIGMAMPPNSNPISQMGIAGGLRPPMLMGGSAPTMGGPVPMGGPIPTMGGPMNMGGPVPMGTPIPMGGPMNMGSPVPMGVKPPMIPMQTPQEPAKKPQDEEKKDN